ncbi:MAG: AAC(3) family N-acetyltransferase [Ktedonobacterales bacterium]
MAATDKTPLTKGDIVAGLRRLGVRPGDLLEVHSSLRNLGMVEGGAPTVITALLDTVGPTGVVVTPTYPVSRALELAEAERARGITWKVRVLSFDDHTTRTGMGIIADTFRTWPGAIRNMSSFFSYTAWGRDAARFALSLEPLVAQGGKVVLLGVEMDRCSCLHLAEERITLPADIQARLALPDDIARDYPDEQWGIGYDPEANFLLAQQAAEARGMITQTTIGRGIARSFDAQTLVTLYEDLLRTHPYAVYGLTHLL